MLRPSVALVVLVLASAAPAGAQTLPISLSEGAEETDSDRDRFAEADAFASAAVALYVTGAVLRLGGAGAATLGAMYGFTCSLGGGLGCEPWMIALIAGAVASTAGLVLVFVGVRVDIESGRRRREADRDVEIPIREDRRTPVSLRLAPMASAGVLGVLASGRF